MSVPPRTTSAKVQGILLRNWDQKSDLAPFIASASAVVDAMLALARTIGLSPPASEVELVERWLSAHMYQQSDRGLTSKSTSGASGSFQGQATQGFDSTFFGQTALRIDSTGCLENIDKTQFASMFTGINPVDGGIYPSP